jgi:tetratricopeptide (TPR) repeat protein
MQFSKKEVVTSLNDNPYLSIRFLYLILASTITIVLFSINFASRKETVLSTTDNFEENYLIIQKNYWQDFLVSNPEYFEGWYEISIIEAKLGQFDDAFFSINKALDINPNSEKAKTVKNTIEPKLGSNIK